MCYTYTEVLWISVEEDPFEKGSLLMLTVLNEENILKPNRTTIPIQ